MAWITVRLRVATPLFNAGANQQNEARLRVPSLRGAMRFWLRALAGYVTGPHLTALSALEERVFGSAQAASPVAIRIPQKPPVTIRYPRSPHDFLSKQAGAANQPGKWIIYLLGQGLGDLANVALRRPYVPTGEEFEIQLRFQPRRGDTDETTAAIRGCALAALWLTCAYGGVGARVRRGFGGLRIVDVKDPGRELPESWPSERLLTPGLEHFRSLHHLDPAEHLESALTDIRTLTGIHEPIDGCETTRPAFPVLHRAWTQAGTSSQQWTSWIGVLSSAGEQLRHFRANQPYPGAGYQPPIKTQEWTAVVHRDSLSFPLGALGLPVVYKDGYSVNAMDTHNRPARRASSLWLRPVGDGDAWRLFSFAFTNEFLPGPDAPIVKRYGPGMQHKPPLNVDTADLEHTARRWIAAQSAGLSFTDRSTPGR